MRPVETPSSVPLRDEVSWTTGASLIPLVKKVSRSVGKFYHLFSRHLGCQTLVAIHSFDVYSLLFVFHDHFIVFV